jgi:hypothetical protein
MATGATTRESPFMPYGVHALQKVANYNDTGIASGIPFNVSLPQDAQVLCTIVRITAAFNASSPILTVGTNSTSFNDLVAAADADEATTGADIVWTGAELDTSGGPLLPYVKYTDSGGGSAGRAIITILYIPPVDR